VINLYSDRFDEDVIKYEYGSLWTLKCKRKGHEFEIKSDIYYSRKMSNVNPCTICNPIGDKSPRSIVEMEILHELSKYTNCISSYRELGKEIDIFLPDEKIGIEFNGLYWHCDNFKDKKYHSMKSKLCEENGIELIHIWEDEWRYKKDIVLSLILNRINKNKKKIYSRNCNIKEIDYKTKNEFLENNHIQGKSRSSINIGLYHKKDLVSVMTFGKRNLNSKVEYELVRFCNKINTNVLGSFSKLFKYFIRNNEDISEIISYSDNSKFSLSTCSLELLRPSFFSPSKANLHKYL